MSAPMTQSPAPTHQPGEHAGERAAQDPSCREAALTEAFATELMGRLNASASMLMVSVGHRTRLFDIMSTLGWATPSAIARAAGLSERYVLEWLGAMVTSGIIEQRTSNGADAGPGEFFLPAHKAAVLTRAASPNNLAVTAQWLAVMAGVESRIVEAFKHGRGVPYSAYERFHEVMADESQQTVVAALEPHILPLVPGLKDRLESGIRVLDIGCGSGQAMIHLARRFPRTKFTGVDFSDEAVRAGRHAAREPLTRHELGNLFLEVGDAATFGSDRSFDLVTAFDAIHDQAHPQEVLRNVARVLAPGGVFLMQDIKSHSSIHDNIGAPLAPFIYTISCMHCMSVSLAHGGPGLGAAWGRELAMKMLADAGFVNVTMHELAHDPINDYYVCRTG